jgi:hypothetical protein
VTMKTQIHFFLSGLLPGKERGEVGWIFYENDPRYYFT